MTNNIKPMPSNDEAERAVLGAILLEPDALYEIDLDAGEFYLEKHAWIYEAMHELSRSGAALNVVTLSHCLSDRGQLDKVGGSAYLVSLLSAIPTAAHVRSYADLVRREHIRRQLAEASMQIAGLAYDAQNIPTPDLKPLALSKLLAVDAPTRGGVKRLGDAIADFLPTFNDYCDGRKEVWGIPTGLDIDKYTGGLQPGDLWIVAGYPGKGKTSLALNVALAVAQHGAVLLFTLEMSIPKLMLRIFSEAGHISSEDIRRGRITGEQRANILNAVDRFAGLPIYLIEEGQSTDSIRARVAQLQEAGEDIKLVVIDYMRLLKDRADNELVKTANVSRACKLLARDYQLTTILIHSLNRTAVRAGEKPGLQSLSYAGDYDADVVMLTHFEDDRPPYDKSASILIAKNRSGRVGEVPMVYLEEQTTWQNMAH